MLIALLVPLAVATVVGLLLLWPHGGEGKVSLGQP